MDKRDHTSHQKVWTFSAGWRWQLGGAELFSSTQHRILHVAHLLSHMQCEAEMYLTGLHEWVSWFPLWTPLTLFRQKNLSSLELTEREWQHYGCGRIETCRGWNIANIYANIYTMMTAICLPKAKSVWQKLAGAQIVPTIQGTSRALQTDGQWESRVFASMSDLVWSSARSNISGLYDVHETFFLSRSS